MASNNKLARFEFANIPRVQITEASYNPRFLDDAKADKLNEVLRDVGLVEPLVFNKRTGNLVGGHQRMRQMDAIHGNLGYDVPCSVIDVDEVTEKKINLLLNNPGIAGEFDVEKLEALFRNDTDPFTAGFDPVDLREMFDNDTVLLFIDKFYPETADDDGSLPGQTDRESLSDTEAEIAKIKEARKEHKEADRESLRADHILVIVFDNSDQCTKAMNALRLNPAESFVFAPKALAAMKEYAAKAYEVVTKPHA